MNDFVGGDFFEGDRKGPVWERPVWWSAFPPLWSGFPPGIIEIAEEIVRDEAERLRGQARFDATGVDPFFPNAVYPDEIPRRTLRKTLQRTLRTVMFGLWRLADLDSVD